MSSDCQREMTLQEWVERLPEIHSARKEYAALVTKVEKITPTNNESDAILALRDLVKMVDWLAKCDVGLSFSPIERGKYNRAKDVLKRARIS